MDKSKIYINLSKCTEEERKSLPQILEKAGQEVYFLTKPTLLSGKLDMYYPYLVFSRPSSNVWVFSHNKPDITELTYPEFIKLFEGGESKEVLKVENREFILCASLKFYNNIVSGHRHSDCYELIRKMCPNIADTSLPQREDQGFLTSLNRHVDRKEGWKIAKENNQIKWGLNASDDNEESQLISENLY